MKLYVCLNKHVGELQTSPWAEGTVSAAKHQASFKTRAPGLLLIPPLQLALPSLQARTRKSLKVDYENKKNNQPTPTKSKPPPPTPKKHDLNQCTNQSDLQVNELWFYIHRAPYGEGKPETCSTKETFYLSFAQTRPPSTVENELLLQCDAPHTAVLTFFCCLQAVSACAWARRHAHSQVLLLRE